MRPLYAISPRPSTRLALRHVLARLGIPHEIVSDTAAIGAQLERGEPSLLLLDARLPAPTLKPGQSILWLVDENSPRPQGDQLRLPEELEQLGRRLPEWRGDVAMSPPAGEANPPPVAFERIALRPLESDSTQARPHRSASWAELERRIAILAPHDVPVLIWGESGTGKELVARALHDESPRRGEPMVAVHCGAIPGELLESELFGHERGAFTDAHRRHVGRFESAAAGTILLDEIGELPLSLQAKLLRVLQERAFQRVGGSELLAVRARVLAATNRDLEAMVRAGKFRQDLLHRLLVASLHLPPLRERPEDVEFLTRLFLFRLSRELGRPIEGVEESAWAQLRAHDWPGNVRELEHLLRRALLLASGPRIGSADLRLEPMAEDATGVLERLLRRRLEAGESGANALERLSTSLREAAEKLGITGTRP